MRRYLLLVALLTSFLGTSFGQEIIKGVIKDDSGGTLPGATVFIKGTNTSAVADINGEFGIPAAREFPFTIVINSVGFKAQEIEIYELTGEILDVSLKTDNLLDEVVVVGYGEQKRSDFTGSLGSIPSELKTQPVSSPERLLQGSVSGVQVTQSSGQPGGGVSIRIRGGTSINAGNEPLYVIDGFPVYNGDASVDAGVTSGPKINPLSNFNPSDSTLR